MAEDTREVKRTEKIRGQDITGKVMVLAKTHPQQLILFQTFLPEDLPFAHFEIAFQELEV